ncbi:MAG: SpoIIIAH-like family protein [Clostridiales bacterium]|nr:SpoIIIAH-like family protein [Clostridiales bacterium]
MTGGIFMKVWKKNLVAAAILVTVCAGIYVNWLYTEDSTAVSLEDSLDAEKVMSDDSLALDGDMAAIAAGEDVATTASDYFAAVRLSRQQARDNAVNLLQEAMAYADTTTGSKELESAASLDDIVQTALSEAQIESLVIAKGYADCVAYMSGDGISVAVSSPEGGLQQADVAVIADIVMSQSDYALGDIRVVEVQ